MASSSPAWDLLPADFREKVDEALSNCPWPGCEATRESVALDIWRARQKPAALPPTVFPGARPYNNFVPRLPHRGGARGRTAA